MPIEYDDLARIYGRLSKNKEAEKYHKLGDEAAKSFDTGF